MGSSGTSTVLDAWMDDGQYQRHDVLAGLEVIASDPSIGESGWDGTYPGLGNAITWVVDDTWWDQNDPSTDLGRLLHSTAEVEAVRHVVAAILDVARRHEPGTPDSEWVGDVEWPRVRLLAGEAATLMRENNSA
jgi:hypothetical protein